ncbi:MAG: hypothetical protein KF718_10215, partial [Polyangiaceae bacterium]|nr:hypothetical protein [Polyangiaceae bacterium]
MMRSVSSLAFLGVASLSVVALQACGSDFTCDEANNCGGSPDGGAATGGGGGSGGFGGSGGG